MTTKTKKSLFQVIADSADVTLVDGEYSMITGPSSNHRNISIYVCVGGFVKINDKEMIVRGKKFNLHLKDMGTYCKVVIHKYDDIYPFLNILIEDIVPKYIDNEYLFKSWFSNGDGFDRFIYSIYNTAYNVAGIGDSHFKGSRAMTKTAEYTLLFRKDKSN